MPIAGQKHTIFDVTCPILHLGARPGDVIVTDHEGGVSVTRRIPVAPAAVLDLARAGVVLERSAPEAR